MVLPLIALCCTLASCILSFLLQKNCKATSIRFHGKKIEIAKKMVIADVYDVFIKDGQYYAKCGIKNNPVQQVIEIDKAMMASFPNQKSENNVPVQQVLLYEECSEPGMCVYSLTPEEIRYKINLQVIQDEKKTMEDIQEASDIISGYYQVRLVLFTLAWVGIYRSPILSILFSVAAIAISLRNTIPLRCTKLGKCGIIKKIGESATGKKADTLPPGYDNWSEESRYLYSLEQQVEAKKQGIDATSDESVDETEEIADTASDVTEDAALLDDEGSIEEDDEEDEEPFFTDEELASEGQEDGEEDLLSDSDGDSEDQDAAFSSDDDDEDEDDFEADGFEADDASDDTTNLAKSDKEAPAAVPPKGQGSKNSSTAKKGGKKTVQSVLDDLMSEDEDIQ